MLADGVTPAEVKLDSFVRNMEGGDTTTDTERIRILSSTSTARGVSLSNNDRSRQQCSSSFTDDSASTTAGVRRKRSSSNGRNEGFSQDDRTFYTNGSVSLSPSDLERSWKPRRSSMNGRIPSLRRSKSECKISIHRNPVDNTYIDEKYGMMPSESASEKATKYIRSQCSCSVSCLISLLSSVFPVLAWLPKYKLEYLIPDVIAGFTISILHIPQGMAYGILASVSAENGLYVSFFPVLIYFLLGTSKHISIGTFAVVSLMLSGAVYSTDAVVSRDDRNVTTAFTNGTSGDDEFWPPTHLEIVTTIALTVGLWQLFMGIFRLGSLTVVLSDQLISGFSTGAACHVAVSQMKDLFGINVGRYSGPLKLVYMLKDVFMNIVHANSATIIVSCVAIFLLAVFKEQIDGRLKGRLKMPIPIDLIVVVLATTASYFGKFNQHYSVAIMENIPTGLPAPVVPRFDIMKMLIGDSFAIAMVAFAVSLSMAKLLSKKHKYLIRPNQELLALGCANIFASFFACYPCSASLSRSLVQEKTGGKTQIAGLVSCVILLVVLLALAPMFYDLPKCILSCVILVALKGMFLQVTDFFKAWGISKLDALIWLFTFLSTVFLDVIYGLVVGVLFSILSVIARTVIPAKTFLGRLPDTDIYLDMKRYSMAQEVKGVKILHFESALYFINRELFKAYLNKCVPIQARNPGSTEVKDPNEQIHRIIIDCSTFTFVDLSGLETLLEIMKEYQEVGITVYLSGCSIAMQEIMERAKFYEKVFHHPAIFPTIQDAVEYHYLPHTGTTSS